MAVKNSTEYFNNHMVSLAKGDVGAPYLTLLFYNYVEIPQPQKLVKEQKQLCKSLNLTGRLRISIEGVNGCFGGSPENIESYINIVENDPRFKGFFQNVDWKKGPPNKIKLSTTKGWTS